VTSINFETKSLTGYLIAGGIGILGGGLFLWINDRDPDKILGGFVWLLWLLLILGAACILIYFLYKISILNISTEKDVFTYSFKGPQAEEIGLNLVKYIRKGMNVSR
jgi:hypothetical protein